MEIIDLIYEAALVPELWPSLLNQLAQLSRSVGSALFLFGDNGLGRGVTLDNLSDLLGPFLTNKDLRFSTSVVRMCELKPNSFVEVDQYMSATEIERDPIRIELRARGMGVHICTAVPMPTGEIAIYVLQKPLGTGGYSGDETERLNELRPHLARAGLVALRLGLEKAKSTVAALESLGLAAAVCSNGRTIAANSMFLKQPDLFRIGGQDRLKVASGPANSLLQAALSEGGVLQTVRSIPVIDDSNLRPGLLHVLPLRRAARDVLAGGDSIVVYTSVRASELVPVPSVLSGLFDLTPAEARLAASLASGQSLNDAADVGDIKFNTARSYLEQIFRKTGTKRQSQLVALLKSAGQIRWH